MLLSDYQYNSIFFNNHTMFSYYHPLITEGAGRIKTDPINE